MSRLLDSAHEAKAASQNVRAIYMRAHLYMRDALNVASGVVSATSLTLAFLAGSDSLRDGGSSLRRFLSIYIQ